MKLDKEKVFGVQVNRGVMSKLAKTILSMHILFMITYFIQGLVMILSTMTQVEPEFREEWEGEMILNEGRNSGLAEGLLAILGSVGVFFLVRSAIQQDNKGLVTCMFFCDGACACCNFALGIVLVLGLVGLSAANKNLDEHCHCNPTRPKSKACEVHFDNAGCTEAVQHFHDLYPVVMIFVLIILVLVCCELFCCAYTASHLSTASQKMVRTPFCCTPSMDRGSIVVGEPVQGDVVSVAKPTPESEQNPNMT